MWISHFFLSMLALDIDLNKLHRPRAVQGVHGNEILNIVWFQLLQVHTHPFRFKLECTDGLAPLVQLERLFIIQGDLIDIDLDVFTHLDIFNGILDD